MLGVLASVFHSYLKLESDFLLLTDLFFFNLIEGVVGLMCLSSSAFLLRTK